MITLIIACAFRGTKAEYAKAVIASACIDALVIVSCLNCIYP